MSDFLTLPDRLLERADEFPDETDGVGPLMRAAAQRICELEVQVLALRFAIAGHRAAKDFSGDKEPCDRRLWEHVKDVPWAAVRGDG